MTIIKNAPRSEPFTTFLNEVLNDERIDTKYLGVLVRLYSKSENWEISVAGLAKLFPSESEKFYRRALKQLTKYGYLIRIPQMQKNGRFQKALMELHGTPQIKEPLTDEEVDILWSRKPQITEEIKKKIPQVENVTWKPSRGNRPTTKRKKNETKEDDKKEEERKEIKERSPEPSSSGTEEGCASAPRADALHPPPPTPQQKEPNKPKEAFGDMKNVKLTREEHEKLVESLGDKVTDQMIDKLDLYVGSTGKKYKSHYCTILNWMKKEKYDEEKFLTKMPRNQKELEFQQRIRQSREYLDANPEVRDLY